ncbi:MAG TPA: hypothetical protein VFS71_08355 [Flavobacterium sp.]|uniref:hypothetical protein n=1 Tax=Flavobacterium sp. TaxID=239 RepID=UPI002DB7EC7A|nr:hypothetical protein [Flavobacterium sp.]HEU4789680.1 hypothetical protein [Flavobacterium sp.]
MKNKILLYTVIVSLFSFNCWTQKKIEETKVNSNSKNEKTNKKIKYYHVEETSPLKFGGFKTVYDVRDPKLIRTYDLGPNNKRTITPVYEDAVIVEHAEPTLKSSDSLKKIKSSVISISDKPKKTDSYAYIDIIKTYERVSDKGYESIDMLKKVGNSYFFNDELEKAEKCYGKLFSLTTDLEPEYYYRYSIALKAMGKTEQSDEFFKKFNQLSSNKTSK